VADVLVDLKSNWDVWGNLLGEAISDEAVADREKAILSFFQMLVTDEQQREHRDVIDQAVSSTRMAACMAAIREDWRLHAWLTAVLKEDGALERRVSSEVPKDAARLQSTGLIDRRQLIDNPGPTRRIDIGSAPADAVGNSETDFIYNRMRAAAIRAAGVTGDTADALSDVLRELRTEGHEPDIVLVSGGWGVIHAIQRSPSFARGTPRTQDHPVEPYGSFAGVPIYTHHEDGPAELLIASVRHLGMLVERMDEDDIAVGGPHVSIELLTEERARQFAESDRRWLPEGLKALPTEELIYRLTEAARVDIVRIVEFRVVNDQAAFLLTLRPEE
jgi:hypothetical protein